MICADKGQGFWDNPVILGSDQNINPVGRFSTREEIINAYSMKIFLTIDVVRYNMLNFFMARTRSERSVYA